MTFKGDTFVENGATYLTCSYTFKYNDSELILNEGVIISYIWYKDEKELQDDPSIKVYNDILTFENLDKLKHNGNYSCSILLNNLQSFNSTPFEMIIYKSIFFLN